MQKEKGDQRSGMVFAVILIIVGMLWMPKQLGLHIYFDELLQPFRWVFIHLGNVVFSWPMVLLVIGTVMLAGKRKGGWVLVVIGGVFILPRVFNLPDFSFSLIFPLAMVMVGVSMVIRRI